MCMCVYVCAIQLGIESESETELTESVHLNPPQNMRESVVVTRRFLFRRDWRNSEASSLEGLLLGFVVSMVVGIFFLVYI